MLCSSCSEIVRPVVVWDIDGTLGDYHLAFTRFVERYWYTEILRPGNMGHPAAPAWDGEGEFEDFLGLTKEQYRLTKLAYRQGGNKRWMPVYSDAAEAVALTSLAGAEVWITTTRPWQKLDNVDPDTRWWLLKNDIPYNHMIYDADKLLMITQQVDPSRIVAVIDDLPEQYDRATELGLPVIQRRNHHNAGASSLRYNRGDLGRCAAWARQQITEWRQ